MKNYQITQWCANFIRQQVTEGDFCIDATMGNGNDTLLLSQLCKTTGKVLAFDIQKQALAATREKLVAELATRGETSIQALTQALSLLKKGGMISLCIYSGGDSGFDERNQILSWLKELDPHKYLVIKSEYYNRPNNPPIPVLIIKN